MIQSHSRKMTGKMASSNVQIIFGYILAIPCGLSGIILTLSPNSDPSAGISVAVVLYVFMIAGLVQIIRGKRRKRLIQLFRKLDAILSTNSFRSMEQLASAAGMPVAKTEKYIVELFAKGYFENAYFDTERNCIVFTGEVPSVEEASNAAQVTEVPAEYARVTCNSCGAKNKIQKGTVVKCEFCGTYLSES